jgi:hypothetical protein
MTDLEIRQYLEGKSATKGLFVFAMLKMYTGCNDNFSGSLGLRKFIGGLSKSSLSAGDWSRYTSGDVAERLDVVFDAFDERFTWVTSLSPMLSMDDALKITSVIYVTGQTQIAQDAIQQSRSFANYKKSFTDRPQISEAGTMGTTPGATWLRSATEVAPMTGQGWEFAEKVWNYYLSIRPRPPAGIAPAVTRPTGLARPPTVGRTAAPRAPIAGLRPELKKAKFPWWILIPIATIGGYAWYRGRKRQKRGKAKRKKNRCY